MFPYTPTQLFTMQPHLHHHHHHHQHHHQQQQQQVLYAQQQQQANLLFYQYNQLQSMHGTYSNPALPSITFDQTQAKAAIKAQKQQPAPQVHIQRLSPVNMPSISSTDAWQNGSSLQNPEVFRRVIRTISNTMLDASSYNHKHNGRVGSTTSTPLMPASLESPKSHRRHSTTKQESSLESHQHRQRLHSGSSCYESDSPGLSSDEEEFEWRPLEPKALETMSPKKRTMSLGRTDLPSDVPTPNDVYHSTLTNHGLFPTINPGVAPMTNRRTSTKSTGILARPRILQYIAENVIGNDHLFYGPWGQRRMIYCDYTASGRSLQFIEDYIKAHVLPLYGNTHSETSLCAQQSTRFREEARRLIKASVNATDDDILLFTGTGSTGAVHTLVDTFQLDVEHIRESTVVIISAFEHHSNILPWKETGVEMVRIPTTQQGILDVSVLEENLDYYSKLNRRIICSLNAASNITGILTDVDAVSALVHSYEGLIFWDYASAAPYVKIDMNPSSAASKDAIFISTHKFVGGPGSPGILIAKKHLFSLRAPRTCGGGTVNFVTRTCHEYSHDFEVREEGGTPDIVGCIRAGLVFQLKDSIDAKYLQAREDELVKRFNRRFKSNDNLFLLGSPTAARLPIFSFLVYVPGVCKYLHHNFVCLLLNDLFGLQVRSGCACAGPYALDLLNVNDAKTDIYCMFMTEDSCARTDSDNEQVVRTMMMKPGFTRLNLSFFAPDDEIEYVLNAVQFVATEGWKFLPLYTYDPVTAGWSHRTGFQLAQSSLDDISYKSGKMQYSSSSKKDSFLSRGEKILPDPFRDAKSIAADALRRAITTIDYTSDPPLNVPDKYKHMVWFALPIDIALMLVKQKETGHDDLCSLDTIPFIPSDAKERLVASMKANKLCADVDAANNRKRHSSSRRSSTSRNRT